MNELTARQQEILDYIGEYQRREGCAPVLADIARRFRFRSPNAVSGHIRLLRQKGVLEWTPGKARSLRLTNPAGARGWGAIVNIPLLGSVPAGFGDDGEAESEECIPVALEALDFKPTQRTFALRVTGDSMIGRHICDGDIVILEHGAEARSGQIVAALIDRKRTLKTYIVQNRRPFLKAENPKYPNLLPAEELMIQGVFRMLIRQAKT